MAKVKAYNKIIVKDLGWDEIVREHKKLTNTNIKIGLFGEGNVTQNVAARGYVHEFGRGNNPQRPFMRQAFEDNKDKLTKKIQKWYTLVVNDKMGIKKFLNRIGVLHTGQIQRKIRAGNFIPLKPKTIKKKKSTRPLIDTAVMLNSVKHKIEKEG